MANLAGAKIYNKDLYFAKFDNANLAKAEFRDVKINDTSFCDAILSYAVFKGGNRIFYGSNFDKSDLSGVDLSRYHYELTSFNGIDYDKKTRINTMFSLEFLGVQRGRTCVLDDLQ